MDFFGWEDWYTLGLEDFDAEHRNIARLQTELHDALQAGRHQTELRGLLGATLEAMRSHFEHEERMLAEANYAKLDLHQRQHAMFFKQVDEYVAEVDAGYLMISIKLVRFLRDWMVNHIDIADQLYAKEYASKA